MGEQVHGQGWHGHVDFPTRRALFGHLAFQAPVRLFVPAQVGRRCVCFATFVARVSLEGPRAAEHFPTGPAIRDQERVHGVTFAHRVVAVDVPGCDLGLRAVGLVRVRCPIVAVVTVVNRSWRRYFSATVTFSIVNGRGDVVSDVA